MTVLATDNFNRADAGNPGTNWTLVPSNSNLRIVSNNVEANSDPSMMAWNANAAPNDGASGLTVLTRASTAGQGMGPGYRISTAANTGYFTLSQTGQLEMYKVVSTTYTSLGSFSGTVASGDILEMRCVGTTISVRQNGTQRISATDSAISSGSAGIFGSIDGAIHPTGDDWYLDDLAGGGAVTPTYPQLEHATGRGSFRGIALGMR